MPQAAPNPHALRVADLPQRSSKTFDLRPTAEETEALRAALDLQELRKVRLHGALKPLGKRDWSLEATLGATVSQPCVVTLAPVTTRIDTEVSRQFVTDYAEPDAPEAEMPEDDTVEPLGAYIDLFAVLTEALSLSLPLYPRADGAEDLVEIRVTEPGKAPMTDDDAKPFAGLAALKSQLGGGDKED